MAHRVFVDTLGVEWQVWEVIPAPAPRGSRARGRARVKFPPGYDGGWLTFQSIAGRRRLGPIPKGWAELDLVDLVSLLEQAQVVPRLAG